MMHALFATCLLSTGLLWAAPAVTTRAVTIKMVLNNGQARTVRDAEGQPVTIKLTSPQKALVRVRAPKFQGNTIRVASGQLSAANKISLTIFKPGSATPVLRVEARGTRATDESSEEEAINNMLAEMRVEIAHMQEKLAAFTKRLETVGRRLRGR